MSPEECSPAVMFTRYFIAIPEDPSPSASIPGQNANKLFTFSPSETVSLYSRFTGGCPIAFTSSIFFFM